MNYLNTLLYYNISFWNPTILNSSNPPIFNTTSTMASATSTSATSASAANTAKDAFYHSVKNTIYHCSLGCLASFEPFTATYNGKQIPFVGKVNHIATDTIYELAKKEWGCHICAHRMKTMAKMVGAKGPWLSGTPRTAEDQRVSDAIKHRPGV